MALTGTNDKSWAARHFTPLTLLLGLVLAVIPGVAHHFEHLVRLQGVIRFLENSGLFTLIERFGDALFIAAFLWLLVEKSKHDEFLENLSKRLLVNMFGADLPDKLRKHIQTYFNFSLVRTSWTIEYWIDQQGDSPDHLSLVTHSKYTMRNYASEAKDYEFIFEVEESQCSHPANLTEMIIGTKTSAPSTVPAAMILHEGGYLKFKRSVGPPPQPFLEKIKPGSEQTFTAKSTECFKNFLVSPFWATYPVLETTFTVYHDDSKIQVYFEMTSQDTPKPQNVSDLTGRPGKQWTTQEPLLPGHGFFVRANFLPSGSRSTGGASG